MIKYPMSFFNNILIPLIMDYSNKIIPGNILPSLYVNSTVGVHNNTITTTMYPQPTLSDSLNSSDSRPLFNLLTLFFSRIAHALSVGDLFVLNALKALVLNIYSLKEYFWPKKSKRENEGEMKNLKVEIIHQTNVIVNGIYNVAGHISTPNTFSIPNGSKLLMPYGNNLIKE